MTILQFEDDVRNKYHNIIMILPSTILSTTNKSDAKTSEKKIQNINPKN